MNPLELIKEARNVKQNAYQPYSEYSVGAALYCILGRVPRVTAPVVLHSIYPKLYSIES